MRREGDSAAYKSQIVMLSLEKDAQQSTTQTERQTFQHERDQINRSAMRWRQRMEGGSRGSGLLQRAAERTS